MLTHWSYVFLAQTHRNVKQTFFFIKSFSFVNYKCQHLQIITEGTGKSHTRSIPCMLSTMSEAGRASSVSLGKCTRKLTPVVYFFSGNIYPSCISVALTMTIIFPDITYHFSSTSVTTTHDDRVGGLTTEACGMRTHMVWPWCDVTVGCWGGDLSTGGTACSLGLKEKR